MAEREHEQVSSTRPLPIEAIHYYPAQRRLVIEARGGLSFAVAQRPEGWFGQLLVARARADAQLDLSPACSTDAPVEGALAELTRSAPAEPGERSPTPAAATEKGKAPTIVVPGKLQTRPTEGRPDRHGKPTAWARLLGHIEGKGATLLSTSFHGRTREIALGLAEGAHVTAQGYLHLRGAGEPEGRLSTFSVIHLVQYPGKPEKGS